MQTSYLSILYTSVVVVCISSYPVSTASIFLHVGKKFQHAKKKLAVETGSEAIGSMYVIDQQSVLTALGLREAQEAHQITWTMCKYSFTLKSKQINFSFRCMTVASLIHRPNQPSTGSLLNFFFFPSCVFRGGGKGLGTRLDCSTH